MRNYLIYDAFKWSHNPNEFTTTILHMSKVKLKKTESKKFYKNKAISSRLVKAIINTMI